MPPDKSIAQETAERLAHQERMRKAGAEFSALLDAADARKRAATEGFLGTLRSSKESREGDAGEG